MDSKFEAPPLNARVDGDSRPPGLVRRWLRGWRFFLTFFLSFWFSLIPLLVIKLAILVFGGDPDKGAIYETLCSIYFFTGFPLAFRATLHNLDVHVVPSC